MSNRKRQASQQQRQLPPIINEDDGELPFFKPDFFSDVTLNVPTRKLFTARCLLAYNSPVFEKQLANSKKAELDMSSKNYDDVVELLCYLDPRVPYTLTAQSAKQLLPLAEEYEMYKLRRNCENVLHAAFEQLRRNHRVGHIPSEINEEYLIMADRYRFDRLLHMCIDEYVHCAEQDLTKTIINADTVSDTVKLVIMEKKLARLNTALDRERKYKHDRESQLSGLSPTSKWSNKFGLY